MICFNLIAHCCFPFRSNTVHLRNWISFLKGFRLSMSHYIFVNRLLPDPVVAAYAEGHGGAGAAVRRSSRRHTRRRALSAKCQPQGMDNRPNQCSDSRAHDDCDEHYEGDISAAEAAPRIIIERICAVMVRHCIALKTERDHGKTRAWLRSTARIRYAGAASPAPTGFLTLVPPGRRL